MEKVGWSTASELLPNGPRVRTDGITRRPASAAARYRWVRGLGQFRGAQPTTHKLRTGLSVHRAVPVAGCPQHQSAAAGTGRGHPEEVREPQNDPL